MLLVRVQVTTFRVDPIIQMCPPVRVILERLVKNVVELFCIGDYILYGPVRLLEVYEFRDGNITPVNSHRVSIHNRIVKLLWNSLAPVIIILMNLKFERSHHILDEIIKRLLVHLVSLGIVRLLTPLGDGHASVVHLATAHRTPTLRTLEIPSLDARLAKLVSAHEGAVDRVLVAHWALHVCMLCLILDT